MGSMKNDLLLPPTFKRGTGDEEELDEDLMLLGTTPVLGSAGPAGMVNASARMTGAAAVVREASHGMMHSRISGDSIMPVQDGLVRHGLDLEEDDLMGMSPDLPSMIRSPMVGTGFADYMQNQQQPKIHDRTSSIAAAVAVAPNDKAEV